MNLQSLTVIFAIIILPIVLVVSVYLQGQIDTIALQNKYDNMLINATHDAVSALERNIANEDLSTVSDSLRSMIEASKNIFFNTLSTNMGVSNASESYFKTYVPSLLYTLYDGFYIYSPTNVPVIAEKSTGVAIKVGDLIDETNGNNKNNWYKSTEPDEAEKVENTFGQILYETKDGGYTTNIKKAKTKIGYVLKPYIYYNANYDYETTSGKIKKKISVNYSLDNYISISGTIGDVYYSKSGYLINPDFVKELKVENSINSGKFDGVTFNENQSTLDKQEEEFYEKYKYVIQKLQLPEYENDLLKFNDDSIINDFCKLDGIKLSVVLENADDPTSPLIIQNYDGSMTPELKEQATDAICYYGRAKIFSDWVKENFSDLQPGGTAVLKNYDIDYTTTYLKDERTTKYLKTMDNIFDIGVNNNPEDPKSAFCEHKREVIKSSIQYNLNNAISNYSSMSEENYEMPIISELEWDTILSNVTMISFMQQLPCKGKTYNNYAIVPSTTSELTVIPNNLYYVVAGESDDKINDYHRIDCKSLKEKDESNNPYDYLGYRNIEYIYDKKLTDDGYEYDHKNLGCYECIISSNYDKTEFKSLADNKKRAYYTVLGKERNNLYKTTATVDNYGFEITNFEPSIDIGNITIKSSRKLKEIRSIEVVILKTEIRTNKTKPLTDFELKIRKCSD